VCKVYPKSKILVCAPQNDAADIIAERLLDHVSEKSILRFNAASRNAQSMSDEVTMQELELFLYCRSDYAENCIYYKFMICILTILIYSNVEIFSVISLLNSSLLCNRLNKYKLFFVNMTLDS